MLVLVPALAGGWIPMRLADSLAGWGAVVLLTALAFSPRAGTLRDAEIARAPIGGLLLIGALAAVFAFGPGSATAYQDSRMTGSGR